MKRFAFGVIIFKNRKEKNGINKTKTTKKKFTKLFFLNQKE